MAKLFVRTLLLAYCLFAIHLIVLAQDREKFRDALLERHVAAIGGAEALAAINTLRVQVTIREPGFTISGDYRASRSGEMRIDIYDQEQRVYSEGIDAQGGWQQAGEGAPVTTISAAGLVALQRGIDSNFNGLNRLTARGHSADYAGLERIDGRDYHILDITLQDGFQKQVMLDSETALLRRSREISSLHPDVDPTEESVETVFDNYQSHCGVLRSMLEITRRIATAEEIQHTTVDSVACNIAINSLALQRPQPNAADVSDSDA